MRRTVGRIVVVTGGLVIVTGLLIGVWAPVLREGHAFRTAELGSALMFTGYLIGLGGYTLHGWDEPW